MKHSRVQRQIIDIMKVTLEMLKAGQALFDGHLQDTEGLVLNIDIIKEAERFRRESAKLDKLLEEFGEGIADGYPDNLLMATRLLHHKNFVRQSPRVQ